MASSQTTASTNASTRNHSKLDLAVFVALFVFRLVNAYYLQTFFQPDEYFQALEPAWQLAFGPSSGAWMTWEWREGLRTSVHPMLVAAIYKATDWCCKLMGVKTSVRANALVAAPGVLQALSAACLDQMTWKVAMHMYSAQTATLATAFITVTSPWQWHCSTRTFSNSLEATLTAVSLNYFPWKWFLQPEKDDKATLSLDSIAALAIDSLNWKYFQHAFFTAPAGLYPALCAAAMAFYLRPTNLIIWMSISAALVGCNRNYRKAFILLQSAVIVGVAVLVAFATADRIYYGESTFPPLRFLYFNVVQSLAVFYGRNRIDYYFTEGLPLLLTTALPFAAIAVFQSLQSGSVRTTEEYLERQTRFVFAFTVVTTVLALSAIAHKEVRFIYPLLPILHVLAAKPFAATFDPFPRPRSRLSQLALAFNVATNIYIAGYVGTTHQRGVIDVMHYLRHRQEAWLENVPHVGDGTYRSNSNITVGFLMPCHSTPWRSHLVYPEADAWALTCEPPIDLPSNQRASYLDEADIFYADPAAWLLQNMRNVKTISTSVDPDVREDTKEKEQDDSRRIWPHYLVFFEQLEPTLKAELAYSRYRECRRFFNTHWHDDWRRKGDVVVWCMRR